MTIVVVAHVVAVIHHGSAHRVFISVVLQLWCVHNCSQAIRSIIISISIIYVQYHCSFINYYHALCIITMCYYHWQNIVINYHCHHYHGHHHHDHHHHHHHHHHHCFLPCTQSFKLLLPFQPFSCGAVPNFSDKPAFTSWTFANKHQREGPWIHGTLKGIRKEWKIQPKSYSNYTTYWSAISFFEGGFGGCWQIKSCLKWVWLNIPGTKIDWFPMVSH